MWINLSLNYKDVLFESSTIDMCNQGTKWGYVIPYEASRLILLKILLHMQMTWS